MKVIKPVTFTTSMLISSTATETYATYNPATTYAKDTIVYYQTHLYISLVNSNVGHQPDLTASATYWLEYGPGNVHAMFDNQVSTQTVTTSPLTVWIAPGQRINSLAVLNVEGATSCTIEVRDGSTTGTVIYTKTINMDATIIADWYAYFYEPYDLKSTIILTDIPPYLNPYIKVSLTNTSGNIKCGNVSFGTVYDLGNTQMGATSGIIDYSTKTTDATYGTTTFVKRAFSKRMEVSLFVQNMQINKVQNVLQDIRATPCVWIGTDYEGYETLTMFGFYKDFTFEIAYPTYSLCKLQVEGLI